MTPPAVTLEALLDRYAVLLLDAYGVLVHGSGPLPGGPELIRRLNRSGRPYYLLTNDASRLPASVAARLQGFGLPVPAERVITSGLLLAGYFAAHGLAGCRTAVLGPPDSRQYVVEAGGLPVPAGEPFDALVIGDEDGYPFLETVDAALTSLCRRLDREEPVRLILPNPDAFYPKADGGVGFAAGAIAALFESALRARYPHRRELRFARLGKPEAPIFAEALRRSGTRDMVMVGDQLETDVRGARTFGLDAAWLAGEPGLPALAGLPPELRPTYRLPALA